MEKYNQDYIAICIPCCKINKENSKTLPNICPKTQMPCLAFKQSVIADHKMVMNLFFNATGRVEMDGEFIDNEYVEECCANFEKIRKIQGNWICTMDAY